LILPVTDRLARAHDMDRPIDAVHDRDAVSQSARVLDLDSEVEQAVAIKVPEFMDRVQLGREDKSLPQTRGDQGAVCPAREAAKRAPRDLGTVGCDVQEERAGEELFGVDNGLTAAH